MKKIALSLIACIAIAVSSCVKSMNAVDFSRKIDDGGTDNTLIAPLNPNNGFITFKANGTTVNIDLAQASRAAIVKPRTLEMSGTAKGGINPKFFFHTDESVVGFVRGINIGNSNSTYPANYVQYTDATGMVYSSRYIKDDSFSVYFSDVSYTLNGSLSGVFSGNLQTEHGAKLKIEEGKFSVKFSN